MDNQRPPIIWQLAENQLSNISESLIHPLDNRTSTIHAYFTSMSRLQETINYAEYLNMAHKQHINNKINKNQMTKLLTYPIISQNQNLSTKS